ncbi:MAG TPA: DinB family protein [Flavobacterium sp.]
MLVNLVNSSLDELIDLLQQLSDDDYSRPREQLSGSSVGEHSRHITEMFQCLIRFYSGGTIDYDLRERNKELETRTTSAIIALHDVKANLAKENRDLLLAQRVEGEEIVVNSSYFRELLYNLEHCIHHQALIKIGVRDMNVSVSPNFGVARSTILYRNQCAQ